MDDVVAALARFPYFGPWEEAVTKECCEIAIIKSFAPDTILVGKIEADSVVEDVAYFVLEGTCNVILCIPNQAKCASHEKYQNQHPLTASNEHPFHSEEVKPQIVLPTPLDGKFSNNHHWRVLELCRCIEKKQNQTREMQMSGSVKYLQCATIIKGGCFGLGEDSRNRYIVSSTSMVCLLIPLQFLLQNNPYNIWNRIKQFLALYLPSTERVLAETKINLQWLKYRKEEVLRITRRKNFKSNVSPTDLSSSLRILEPRS